MFVLVRKAVSTHFQWAKAPNEPPPIPPLFPHSIGTGQSKGIDALWIDDNLHIDMYFIFHEHGATFPQIQLIDIDPRIQRSFRDPLPIIGAPKTSSTLSPCHTRHDSMQLLSAPLICGVL